MSQYSGLGLNPEGTGFFEREGSGLRPNPLFEFVSDIFTSPRTREFGINFAQKMGSMIINRAGTAGIAGLQSIAYNLQGSRNPENRQFALKELGDALLTDLGGGEIGPLYNELKNEDPGLFKELQQEALKFKRESFEIEIENYVTDLYNTVQDKNEILADVSRRFFGKNIKYLNVDNYRKLIDILTPIITGLENPNAAGTEGYRTDATQPDLKAKEISEYLEDLRKQRESDEKDDKVRRLLVGQRNQMADNNERSPDQWLARAQALRQDLASRPIHSKSNYELITAGLVQIPYYSTKVQQ